MIFRYQLFAAAADATSARLALSFQFSAFFSPPFAGLRRLVSPRPFRRRHFHAIDAFFSFHVTLLFTPAAIFSPLHLGHIDIATQLTLLY